MARIGSEDVPRGLPCPDHLRCSGKGQKWSSFRALPWLPPRATKREKQDLYSSRASYYVQFIYCTCIAPAFLGTECRMAPTRVMLPAPQWLLDLQSSCDKAVSFHNRRTAYRSVTKAAWSQDCNLSALPLSLSEPNDGAVYVYLFPFPVSQMLSRNLTIQDPCYLIFKGNDRRELLEYHSTRLTVFSVVSDCIQNCKARQKHSPKYVGPKEITCGDFFQFPHISGRMTLMPPKESLVRQALLLSARFTMD